jgi:hypothetical protein
MLDRKLTEDDTASSQEKHSLVSAHNAAHAGGGRGGQKNNQRTAKSSVKLVKCVAKNPMHPTCVANRWSTAKAIAIPS